MKVLFLNIFVIYMKRPTVIRLFFRWVFWLIIYDMRLKQHAHDLAILGSLRFEEAG